MKIAQDIIDRLGLKQTSWYVGQAILYNCLAYEYAPNIILAESESDGTPTKDGFIFVINMKTRNCGYITPETLRFMELPILEKYIQKHFG